MTARVNAQGKLILHPAAREKIGLREGDLLTVKRDKRGQFVLEKHKPKRVTKRFLNPPPLAASILKEIYSKPDPLWDALEREAVEISRSHLVGESLESL